MNHNDLMNLSWHELVQPEDTVLHLGDLAIWYGEEQEYWLEVASELPGKKYMLRGNHDKLRDWQFGKYGFTIIPEFIQKFGNKRVLFSHYPDTTRDGWDINIHGHIHNNSYEFDKEANINHRFINVSVEVMDYKPTRLAEILKV